jgi:hypothetical protein
MITEIKQDKYHIAYDKTRGIVTFEGALLLNGASAYEPILQLLQHAAEELQPDEMTVDVSGLGILNSSGINMMTRFIMFVSDIKEIPLKLTFRAKKQIAWQERLVINLQRLMPELNGDLH